MRLSRQHVWLLLFAAAILLFAGKSWWENRTPRFHFPVDGLASWYSRRSPGIQNTTANNEIFRDQEITCALWDVPFNQRVRVTNKANGKSVVCRVNDRGPHPRFVRQGRVIDLTIAAFRQIAVAEHGLIAVTVELVE